MITLFRIYFWIHNHFPYLHLRTLSFTLAVDFNIVNIHILLFLAFLSNRDFDLARPYLIIITDLSSLVILSLAFILRILPLLLLRLIKVTFVFLSRLLLSLHQYCLLGQCTFILAAFFYRVHILGLISLFKCLYFFVFQKIHISKKPSIRLYVYSWRLFYFIPQYSSLFIQKQVILIPFSFQSLLIMQLWSKFLEIPKKLDISITKLTIEGIILHFIRCCLIIVVTILIIIISFILFCFYSLIRHFYLLVGQHLIILIIDLKTWHYH